MKKIIPENSKYKRAGIAILISEKLKLQRHIPREKEYFIRKSIYQEDKTIINVCILNNRVPKYVN